MGFLVKCLQQSAVIADFIVSTGEDVEWPRQIPASQLLFGGSQVANIFDE